MTVLFDTNILTRVAQPAGNEHDAARTAVTTLLADGPGSAIVSRNLYEFWAVATRPVAGNGLGLSVAECQAEMDQIRSLFPVLPDGPSILDECQALVAAHDCKGKVAHDARIVAAMRTHGLHE